MNVVRKKGNYYLSIAYLKLLNVSENTIMQWRKRKVGIWEIFDGFLYVRIDSIPFATRKKLPNDEELEKQLKHSEDLKKLYNHLNAAKLLHFSKYLNIYQKDPSLSTENVTRFAQLHSVFQSIIELKNEGFNELNCLHIAFNQLYPGKYSTKHALSNAIRKAACDGIMSVALDKRVYGNSVMDNRNYEVSEITKFWLLHITAHASKYSCSKILSLITDACTEKGFKPPSLSWVKINKRKSLSNVEIYKSRYGLQELKRKLPHASLNTAQNINEVWEMDGVTLPFWGEKFKRHTLVMLIDAKSKMIVGYAIGCSESTTLIMAAIRDAVSKTEVLPFEILTDNHVFNKTSEALNMQNLFAKKGARWTVTENPQYKAIVERYNQYLDDEFKNYYGYLGKGIRSKSIEALANSEMISDYVKNFLSENEIISIAVKVVESYNAKPRIKGKSPVEVYKENPNEYSIKANMFDRAELLAAQIEKKIIRGQITIIRDAAKHEFQLPAALFSAYNDTYVLVRYEDLREGIYLFNKVTGEGIIHLPPKDKIHLAKVNQTDEDIEALHRNTGRLKGIQSKAIKELEDITKRVHEIHPDAHAIINRLTTPKDIAEELEQSAYLQQQAQEHGVDLKLLHVPARKKSFVTSALMPKEDKQKLSPFASKNNKIKKAETLKDFDDE